MIIERETLLIPIGGLAQMVERSLSMREVPGSIPGSSILFSAFTFFLSFYLLAGTFSKEDPPQKNEKKNDTKTAIPKKKPKKTKQNKKKTSKIGSQISRIRDSNRV